MNSVIQLLPDAVANQIAAGEVVQRPASAVKELLENSLDAGATDIVLLIKDGGITSMQVVDNGRGMSEFDARLCWERHATSKIRKAEDLFSLKTYGFRGEAMASIAAVAQVEMKTRRESDEYAQFIRIEASEVIEQRPEAAPVGTSITIKNLFYNIPARRNFLKSIPVETKHIVEEFMRQAMANPQVSFAFYNNQQEVYRFPIQSLKDRLLSALGRKKESDLILVEEQTEIVGIGGFVGSPETSKRTRGDQYFFVNGRFIRSAYFHHAVQSAFEGLIEAETHATYALFLEIDPAKVDVNVHPTKTEVKFEDEKHLYNLLKASVRKSLGAFVVQTEINLESPGEHSQAIWNLDLSPQPGHFDELMRAKNGDIPNSALGKNSSSSTGSGLNKNFNPFSSDDSHSYRREYGQDWQRVLGSIDTHSRSDVPPLGNSAINSSTNSPAESLSGGNGVEPITRSSYGNENAVDSELFSNDNRTEAKGGFALGEQYWVMSMNQKLLVFRVQYLQQRLYFEKYRQSLSIKQGSSQTLLFPRMVELNPAHIALAMELQSELGSLGFDFSHFGGNSIIINGLPSQLSQGDEQKMLEQILEDYLHTGGDVKLEKNLSMALTMARFAASRTAGNLSEKEIAALVQELFTLPHPEVTFDGKVIFVEISQSQLFDAFNKHRKQ